MRPLRRDTRRRFSRDRFTVIDPVAAATIAQRCLTDGFQERPRKLHM